MIFSKQLNHTTILSNLQGFFMSEKPHYIKGLSVLRTLKIKILLFLYVSR
ncbi:hypothetical protein HMPREF1880_01565 [Streptococcus agalactiae]|nr:hypothetical protein HMPREF1880_01565 [Streptococcus agalactiae]